MVAAGIAVVHGPVSEHETRARRCAVRRYGSCLTLGMIDDARVLVADDDPLLLATVADALTHLGANVTSAEVVNTIEVASNSHQPRRSRRYSSHAVYPHKTATARLSIVPGAPVTNVPKQGNTPLPISGINSNVGTE